MAPPTDSRTLVSVLSSLVLVAAASTLAWHALAPRSPPAPVDKEHAPLEPPSPGYKTKRERFSLASHRWEPEVDTDDIDDDSDEEGGDGDGGDKEKTPKKGRNLFTVVHRSYPNTPEWASYEDYVAVAIRSKLLVDSLRDVHALQGCEDVFEDEPSIDARDLFLARDEIRKHQEGVRNEATRLAAVEAAADQPSASDNGPVDPVGARTRSSSANDDDDQTQQLVEPKVKTAQALEDEAGHLDVLLTFLDNLFAPTTAKLRRLLEPPSTSTTSSTKTTSAPPEDWHPQISYSLLWALFKPGSIAVAEHEASGEKVAFRVSSCEYSFDRKEPAFEVCGQALVWNGDVFVRTWVHESIGKGLHRVSLLNVAPLDTSSALYAHLVSRGKQYVALTGAAHSAEGGPGVRFLDYDDVLIQVIGHGMQRKIYKSRAEGRAVVDVKGYRKMNPARSSAAFDDADDWDGLLGPPPVGPPVLDDLSPPPSSTSSSPRRPTQVAPWDLALLPPTVYGFSLVAREWGELLVEHFAEIRFRDDAFDRLVLDPDTKRLVKGLVEYNNAASLSRRRVRGGAAVGEAQGEGEGECGPERRREHGDERPAQRTDIIDGKGGGLVIALHGPPGTGKTLTAQAVAETLRVPLYTVGAGSLGVQADVLEKRLRDVLDVAEQWGATLLIDEADVFLAKRTIGDLHRNAMVSVFLRLLEHHSGTLILTTNSIRSIDEAFLSRFSIAITYPNLDRDKRRTIWQSFLELAAVGISPNTTASSSLSNGLTSTISSTYLASLASHSSLNGRQIKNAVRTAQALARSQGLDAPGEEQLDVVIKAVEAFKRDLEEADEQGVYEVAGEGWKDSTSIFN
ncbi:hypothetical protein JCM8208_003820 [Rhodotorula glutinis]